MQASHQFLKKKKTNNYQNHTKTQQNTIIITKHHLTTSPNPFQTPPVLQTPPQTAPSFPKGTCVAGRIFESYHRFATGYETYGVGQNDGFLLRKRRSESRRSWLSRVFLGFWWVMGHYFLVFSRVFLVDHVFFFLGYFGVT